MTKEETLKKIEELKKKAEGMEEEEKVFNPYLIRREDNYYYKIDSTGCLFKCDNFIIENNYAYNRFNSKEYAELRQREIDLQDKMWSFSYRNGWKDEYLEDYDTKYCIYYDYGNNKVYSKIDRYGIYHGNVYFSSKEVVRKAIEKFGNEIKEIYKLRANIGNLK